MCILHKIIAVLFLILLAYIHIYMQTHIQTDLTLQYTNAHACHYLTLRHCIRLHYNTVHTYFNLLMCVYIHTYIHTYIHVCMYVCMYVCKHIYIYI